MDMIIADCGTGEVTTRPLTNDELVALAAHEAEVRAEKEAAEAEKEAATAAQIQAAQALIATSSDQQQADAMTAFMRTLGLPL